MDKVICVGKNYFEHARELGDEVPAKPVLFLKPPSVVAQLKGDQRAPLVVVLPSSRGSVHYECEIVLRVDSHGVVDAVTLGLDLTLRDLQTELKKQGHPWEVSKVFAQSAVVGSWISVKDFSHFLSEPFVFLLDGVVRQKGLGREMRFLPEECLKYAHESFPVCAGDLIFTGTPAGVGPVQSGQKGVLQWGKQLELSVDFA